MKYLLDKFRDKAVGKLSINNRIEAEAILKEVLQDSIISISCVHLESDPHLSQFPEAEPRIIERLHHQIMRHLLEEKMLKIVKSSHEYMEHYTEFKVELTLVKVEK